MRWFALVAALLAAAAPSISFAQQEQTVVNRVLGTVPVEEFEETVFTIGTVPVTPGP